MVQSIKRIDKTIKFSNSSREEWNCCYKTTLKIKQFYNRLYQEKINR